MPAASAESEILADELAPVTPRSKIRERLGGLVFVFVVAGSATLGLTFSSFGARSSLEELGPHIRWCSIAAVAVTGFAAAACASRARVSSARLFTLTFAAVLVYMFSVLAQFVSDRSEWSAVQVLTWPAIPAVYALWIRTALYVTYDLQTDIRSERGYRLMRLFRKSWGWPRNTRWPTVPFWEPFVSWIPASALVIAGFLNHRWFYARGLRRATESWRNWTYDPAWGYELLAV